MAQVVFGAGVFWGTPLTDANGAAIAVPTPVQVGTMQEMSLDLSFETKELFGQNQFAVAVGRGKGKMTGKVKGAQISANAWNSLFFGQTLTAGITDNVYDVVGAAIPATPFTVTVTPPNSGTWTYDLGVRDANGLPMKRVASAPATGEYSVSAGAYVFAAADTLKTVFISYQYTATSTTARKSTVKSLLMGAAPSFKADFYMPFAGKVVVITVPNCIASKMTIATKLDDFAVPELDFTGFADAGGNALYYAITDV